MLHATMYRTQITRFLFSKLSKWPRRCSKTCKVSRRASCPLCTSCIICSCWCIHTLGSNCKRLDMHVNPAACLPSFRQMTVCTPKTTEVRLNYWASDAQHTAHKKSRILPGSSAGPHRRLQCGSVCHL